MKKRTTRAKAQPFNYWQRFVAFHFPANGFASDKFHHDKVRIVFRPECVNRENMGKIISAGAD